MKHKYVEYVQTQNPNVWQEIVEFIGEEDLVTDITVKVYLLREYPDLAWDFYTWLVGEEG